MKDNVIILSGGLSGSSVLSGLIARAGYWLGDHTKKIAYETYENSALVDLNIAILNKSGYTQKGGGYINPPSVEKIQGLESKGVLNKCNDFVEKCNNHRPWLWKDPRLCYTIYFWQKFLDIDNCKFILISRDIRQIWIGMILRAKRSVTIDNLRIAEGNSIEYSLNFLKNSNFKYLQLTFEGLIKNPEESIAAINKYLGINLDVKDLKAIYKGQLYRQRWTTADYAKAKLKFLYYQLKY